MDNDLSFGTLWAKSAECLRGKWGNAILVCIIQSFLGSAGGPAAFLLFPITVGAMLYFLRLARYEYAEFECLFKPFSQYGRMLWGYLRVVIFIFLQFLLLIVPGIIACYRYALTFYVMLDEPGLSVKDAMKRSAEMMKGYKLRLFWYNIVIFFLFMFAVIFTFGIALIWLIPFMTAFHANFYLAAKNRFENTGAGFRQDAAAEPEEELPQENV